MGELHRSLHIELNIKQVIVHSGAGTETTYLTLTPSEVLRMKKGGKGVREDELTVSGFLGE